VGSTLPVDAPPVLPTAGFARALWRAAPSGHHSGLPHRASFTDDNLDTIAGKRDQLTGRIQETYGITKDQAELQVKEFEEIHKDYRPTTSA
jgi:hypothetical protein